MLGGFWRDFALTFVRRGAHACCRVRVSRSSMLPHSPSASPEPEDRLHSLIAGYLESMEKGTKLDRAALLTQHADLADELEAFFAIHDQIHEEIHRATV